MPRTIPSMIAEMHRLRDALEDGVVGDSVAELEGIFASAEVELTKQEGLFQSLLTDKDGKLQNIPENLEAAGTYYRDKVVPQIDDWIVGPGKQWAEKNVDTMHKAGRRLARANLDVRAVSPELVKAAFDNVSVAEKGVLKVGYQSGYQIINTVGDDVGTWFRQQMMDSVVEGIPVTHRDLNVDSLQRRLMEGGRLQPSAITGKNGTTFYRSVKQRAQAIARIESTRIINRTHETLAEETLGDDAVFRNSNPQDSRSTFICSHASTLKAMSLEDWDNSSYGRPPRLSPFHLCRSVLIAGRAEWFDDVPEAQLQGAGLAATTKLPVPKKTPKKARAAQTAQTAQEALSQAATVAAKELADKATGGKKADLATQIDDLLADPLVQHKTHKLNKLIGEFQAVATAAEWAAKKKLALEVGNKAKAGEVVGKIDAALPGAIEKHVDTVLEANMKKAKPDASTVQIHEFPLYNKAETMLGFHPTLTPLYDDFLALGLADDVVKAQVKKWDDVTAAKFADSVSAQQMKFANQWEVIDAMDVPNVTLADKLQAKQVIFDNMQKSGLFSPNSLLTKKGALNELQSQVNEMMKAKLANDFLEPFTAGDQHKALLAYNKMSDSGLFPDDVLEATFQQAQSLGVQAKISEYEALLASVAEGKLGPKKSITVKKKIKKLGDDIGDAFPEAYAPSDIAKAIKAAEEEAASKVSPEAALFHVEYQKLVTTKQVSPVQAAEILEKYKAGKLHGKSSAKAKQAVAAIKDKLEPPPPPVVDLPEPPPPVDAKLKEWAAVDKAWDEIVPETEFTLIGNANVGGAHSKEFWKDSKGVKWMFKPFPSVSTSEATFRGLADEFAYKMQRLLDPDAAEARFVIMADGRRGSIQRWIEGAEGDLRGVSMTNLSKHQVEIIQREHVLDWLISNHDGHGGQLIRFPDGRVIGVDKGQAFKFLGDDKLDFDYHPNSIHGESEPIYNTLMKAFRAGDVELDPKVTLAAIEEFEKITDDAYRAALNNYAFARFSNASARKKFLDNAVARKNALRSDFEDYYRRALKDDSFTFGQTSAVIPEAPKVDFKAPQSAAAAVEESIDHGWQGQAIPFGGEDVEDLRALFFADTLGDVTRTNVKLKLREGGEAKFMKWLEAQDVDKVASVEVVEAVGAPLKADSFYNDILAAVKTVNFHAGDGQYNTASITKASDHKSALVDLFQNSPDTEIANMAEGYLVALKNIDDSIAAKSKTNQFKQYTRKTEPPKPAAAPKPKAKDYTVTAGPVKMVKREAQPDGSLKAVNDNATLGETFGIDRVKPGWQIEVKYNDGSRITYRPYDDANYFAQQGELEMLIPEKPSAATLERFMFRLDEIGFDAKKVADAEDIELMYLVKQAYVTKEHTKAGYKVLMESLDTAGASKTERIAAMRKHWAKKKVIKDLMKAEGVSDLTELSTYNPGGEWQTSFLHPTRQGGVRLQYRFDIKPDDYSDLYVRHELTGHAGGSTQSFFEKVLKTNGAMVSTTEKMRVGVPVSGMSPLADMDTGGASYFFTRLGKGNKPSLGIFFKPRLVSRMDAITYNSDHYGRVTGDFVTTHRKSTPTQWHQTAGHGGNETIFKANLSIVDDIQEVRVASESERAAIIKAFKDRGYGILPDGRKIEDVIIKKGY